MIEFAPDKTQLEMVAEARKLGEKMIRPAEVELDLMADPAEVFKHDLYWSTMQKAFELGFHKMPFPEDVGGLALDPITNGMIWEELGYFGAGFAASLMSCAVAQRLIVFLVPGHKELVERYVVPFCNDNSPKHISAWASSEPNVGSDGKNYFDPNVRHRTTAVKKGDRWVINGTKSDFVSNAGVANLYIVFANVDPSLGIRGSGAFIVPGDAKGVSRGRHLDKLGLRVLNQSSVFFDEVEIPDNYMIFPPGEGYPFLHQSIITVGSVGVGYIAVGVLRAAYEAALEYAKVRVQWGKPIAEHQLIAQKLYEAYQAIETARLLLWKASWMCKAQFPGDLKTSVTARIYATNQAYRHTSELLQVLGGYGISKEYPLEKYLRDARLLPIMDGTNETLMLKAASLL